MQQPQMKVMIDDLTLLKCLGKGSYGEVYLTQKKGKSQLFATKKMDRKYADQPQVSKYLKNEIEILRELNHKNIVKLEDVKITKNHYYLVMEFCNGGALSECLQKFMAKYGRPFSEEIVQYLMRQIIDGMKYIHKRHIIHRDLKLDNILVNFDSDVDKQNLNMMKAVVKIIDFGFATHLGNSNLVYSALGTPINMEPHIFKQMTENKTGVDSGKLVGYDEKADIWSLGTLCYEMLIGQPAFNAKTMEELVQKVESGSYNIPTNLSKEVVSFLNGMLQYNAKKRLSAIELARHHFLTKNVRDFQPIDLRKVSNKIKKNNININFKKNNTIWSIFNEEDENKLINIPCNILTPMDTPIKEEDEFRPPSPQNKRRNTEKIPHLPNFNKNNFNQYPHDNNLQHDMYKRNTQNYQGYGADNRGINPYNNPNLNPRGYGNFPPQMPHMSPNFPPQMPHMSPNFPPHMPMPMGFSPPTIGRVEPGPGQGPMFPMGGRPLPIMQIPTFGVPSPGEDPYSESGYGYNSGIFQYSLPHASNYGSFGGGYGYGYGF